MKQTWQTDDMSSGVVPLRSPRTPHLVGSGMPTSGGSRERIDWAELAGRHVILEEKIDGSEVSFHFDADARLVCRERSAETDMLARGGRQRHLDRLKDWLLFNEDRLFDRMGGTYLVYAEWCAVAHRIFYDRLPSFLIECDVQDKRTGEFLSTERRIWLLSGLGLAHAPVLFRGTATKDIHPDRLVGRSAFCSGSPPVEQVGDTSSLDLSGMMEGVYGKVEENGRVVSRFK
ncbi:RNA ligase family protein [Rhizobium leguminosarum]|uniref:RNA ligase family protein n=1 Tax=Rhizobium leguminosarum TaxID=384 RepID=UPI002E13E7B7|nr:RNA ligase family protein [Rhizobium leguminosarum]